MSRGKGRVSTRGSEMLATVEAVVAAVLHPLLLKEGLPPSRAEAAAEASGKEAAERVRVTFAGEIVYIPMDQARQDAAVYAAFTGENHVELAKQYRVSVNTIYKIIRREAARRKQRQGNLLDIL